MRFGPDYLIPKPFDPRLMTQLAPAVAQAAMDSGVATRPIQDMDAYIQRLNQFVYRSVQVMRPIFEKAKQAPKRLVYAEGEDRRVLQAAQQVIDEGLAYPILVGRPSVIEKRIKKIGLRMRHGKDFEWINILKDDRFHDFWTAYFKAEGRKGVSPEEAKTVVHTDDTVVAALALKLGHADAMLCGAVGRFRDHFKHVQDIIGKREGVHDMSTVSALLLPTGTLFICDTHVTAEPGTEEIVEMTLLAAKQVQAFGLTPKVALLSRSNFGTYNTASAQRMREALEILHQRAPDLEVEGEMHADLAISEDIRNTFFPDSRLKGQANLLVMPNVDAAHITFNLLQALGGVISIGPILVGAAQPVHVLTQSVTVRGLVNMSAIIVAEAQLRAEAE